MGPVAWGALVATMLGCSNGSQATTGAKGAGGAGATGATSATSGSTTASSTSAASVVAATGAGGGGAFVCDPPADPASLYALSAPTYADVTPLSMCRYRGDVMLIVNTAAL